MAATMDNMSISTVTPDVNPDAYSHFPCNIYAGSSAGYLKGCGLDKQTSFNINMRTTSNTSVNLRDLEITCMSFWNHNESFILTGKRNGSVISYALESGNSQVVPMEIPEGSSSLKEIKSHERLVAAAFGNGIVKFSNFDPLEDASIVKKSTSTVAELFTGQNLNCMDHNVSIPNLIATGGKENPLKIWDITSSTDSAVFTAKNVKNDWLNLRCPVWVTRAEFFPQSNKIVTGTGYAQVRLYDPSTQQRRPVIEVKTKDSSYPITALAVRPNSDFQLVIGNTVGTLALVDLRKKDIIRHFKGPAGGVTDIKFHPTYPVFASCGVDCFVNCFDADLAQRRTHSIYMHSQLNCLLFSSVWSLADNGNDFHQKHSVETANSKSRAKILLCDKSSTAVDVDSDNGNDDDMWKSMEVVQTRKRKGKSEPLAKKAKKVKTKLSRSNKHEGLRSKKYSKDADDT